MMGPSTTQHPSNAILFRAFLPAPIPDEYLSRIAILYGTSELHRARDSHSFTSELCQLVKSRRTPLSIVDIPGYAAIDMHMIHSGIKLILDWSMRAGKRMRSGKNVS